jgi:hypothetical protein
MADRIVMLSGDDERRSWEIFEAFSQRTRLNMIEIPTGVEFPLSASDHAIEVVQTLNEIDAHWPDHISLGDPLG